jgi:hypothetical protein
MMAFGWVAMCVGSLLLTGLVALPTVALVWLLASRKL